MYGTLPQNIKKSITTAIFKYLNQADREEKRGRKEKDKNNNEILSLR